MNKYILSNSGSCYTRYNFKIDTCASLRCGVLSPRAPAQPRPARAFSNKIRRKCCAKNRVESASFVSFSHARHISQAAQLSSDLDSRRTVRTAHTCHSRPSLLHRTARPERFRRSLGDATVRRYSADAACARCRSVRSFATSYYIM